MADTEPEVQTEPETETETAAETEPERSGPGRLARLGARLRQITLPRLPRFAASLVAGLLMCASFPPWGWWYCAFLSLALLGWVLTRTQTTRAGGFGYGVVFGLPSHARLWPGFGNLSGPWPGWAVALALLPTSQPPNK